MYKIKVKSQAGQLVQPRLESLKFSNISQSKTQEQENENLHETHQPFQFQIIYLLPPFLHLLLSKPLLVTAMAAKEQVKPLAPANPYHLRSDEEEVIISSHIKLSQINYVMCCGCVSALFLIIAVTAIVLGFTVFHVKGPKIEMNRVTFQGLEVTANGTLHSDTNVTLLADVSIKNPNAASFKYGNTTTTVYYNGTEVGQGRTPRGVAKARRTKRMNVTVDIVPGDILAVPGIIRELNSGALSVSTYTRIQGKVKILMVKKNVVVELNCSITYSFSINDIQRRDCKPRVSL